LRQPHVDQFGVHAFEVGQDEELLDGGVVAHVAIEFGVGVAPLPCGPPEEGDIEQIGLAGVDDRRLRRRHRSWDDVLLDGIRVDAVVEFRERSIEVPREREAAALVVLEALELLDEVELELRAEPRTELEGDVIVCIRAAIPSGAGCQSFGAGPFDPRLGGQEEAVPACLIPYSLEFEGIKIRVV
jgi:hypothetical protein